MKVMIVDDSDIELEMLQHALEQEGFECVSVSRSVDALAAARRHLPDFIVLDLFMPGLSGFEVCKQIKGDPITEDIAIMFRTASGDVHDARQSMHLGCIDYLQKPVSMSDFVQTLRDHEVVQSLKAAWQPARATLELISAKYSD